MLKSRIYYLTSILLGTALGDQVLIQSSLYKQNGINTFYMRDISADDDRPIIITEEEVELEQANASFALLIMLSVLLLSFLGAYVIRQKRIHYIQESGLTIVFGALIGILIRFVTNATRLRSIVRLDPEFFFLILLPPIIFESGYHMKKRSFFNNIGAITVYALVGTTIATLVTGALMYLIMQIGLARTEMSFVECLLYGSLISATDPVSVLSILKEAGVDINLYSNVFGESVLNDAVAIVLYRALSGFLERPVSVESSFDALGQFLLIFVGSLAVGVVVALCSSLLFKLLNLNQHPVIETSILTIFALTSYFIADGFRLSGIVSILFCGIVMAHYTYQNLSHESKVLSKSIYQLVAQVCETLVFVYLGMAIFSFNSEYDVGLIICVLIIIIFARAVHIFPLTWLINCARSQANKMPFRNQLFLWFAGFRGGMAFTLSLSFPPPISPTIASSMLTTTLIVVLFTVLVQGALITPTLEKLKIPRHGFEMVNHEENEIIAEPSMMENWDNNYLKPFFLKASKVTPNVRNEEDVEEVEMENK